MSSFIFGFIMGAVCMFFAIGWLWMRMIERIEPHDENRSFADPGAAPLKASHE